MSITVDQVYKQFSSFTYDDMCSLLGRKDFDKKTVIPDSKIASWYGKDSVDLGVFAAKKEGSSFVDMLNGDKQKNVAELAKVKPNKVNYKNDGNSSDKGTIPMDTSIFDYSKQKIV